MAIKDETRTKIFNTAVELFQKSGYENISISKICEEANVTRNSFYYYYKGKQSLMLSYFEDIISNEDELLKNVLALPNDWEKLWYLYRTYMEAITGAGKDFTRQLLKLSIDYRGGTFGHNHLTNEWCVPLMKNCQNSGIIRNPAAAESLNIICNQLFLGILTNWVINEDMDDPVANAYNAMITVLNINISAD